MKSFFFICLTNCLDFGILEKYLQCFSQERKIGRYKLIFLFLFWVCQVFCVSFKKIFWGGSPPHSYIAKLLKINSLKHSL